LHSIQQKATWEDTTALAGCTIILSGSSSTDEWDFDQLRVASCSMSARSPWACARPKLLDTSKHPVWVNMYAFVKLLMGHCFWDKLSYGTYVENKVQAIFLIQVSTTLLVAGATLTLWTPGQLCLHPPARTQASFKGCLGI